MHILFFSSLLSFLKSWWSYSNLNGYFKEIVAKAKNILSWWLIVENIPRILILALGIKFEFSRLFANSLARASPAQPHRAAELFHPTNMNYRREKINSNNEKWIYRIYARLGFFPSLLFIYFFLRERSDTNAVVVGVGSSSAARSYQAMVEHIFQEPDRRNCWLAQWTLINPPIMDPCFLSVINVPVWLRLIHAVRYILLLPSRCSWLMNVALFYFDKVAKVCAPMHTRIENFKFSFNVFS